MIELEEKLLNYLNKKSKFSFNDIKRELKISNKKEIKLLKIALEDLEVNGKIFIGCDLSNAKNNELNLKNIIPVKKGFPYKLGLVRIDRSNNKYAYINDKKVFFKNTLGALNNDLVWYNDSNEKFVNVQKIVKRSSYYIIGIYNKGKVIPYNIPNYTLNIQNHYGHIEDYTAVKIEVLSNNSANNEINGRIVEELCNMNEPNAQEKLIAISYGFALDFSDEAKNQANNIKREITEDDLKERKDLRNLNVFTIDCDNTKDMDDAVSITKLQNGNYLLGVHIAHVAHYVKPNTPLWKEALKRGTSVYMPGSVIPMLPQVLSNDICSLNPYEDKLTITTLMEFSPEGKLNKDTIQIFPSIIKSNAKLKYSEVNNLIDHNFQDKNMDPKIINDLKIMQELSLKLSARAKERGKLEFTSNEMEIIYDEYKNPVDIKIRNSKSAEKMIENFMIATNIAAATSYSWMPYLYRVHGEPKEDKLRNALDEINRNIEKLPQLTKVDNKSIQNILEVANQSQHATLISNLLLPCMSKAEFSCNNIGHFGLALHNYSQVTSPIRRSNDLINQYLMEKSKVMDQDAYYETEKFLEHIGPYISKQERLADKAEQKAQKVEITKFIRNHLGENINVMIAKIYENEIYLTTQNGLQGYLSDLSSDDYIINEKKQTIEDIHHNKKYHIGDYINLTIKDSLNNGLIIFNVPQKEKKLSLNRNYNV